VERIILPDATTLLDYMLNRYAKTLQNLIVYPQVMRDNIYKTNGVIFSQRVMNKLISKGLAREEAYDLVQLVAMASYKNNNDFKKLLLINKKIMKVLTKKDIDSCFDLKYYFKNVNYIYKKVGIK
jgi:adenylosuccinate lyase